MFVLDDVSTRNDDVSLKGSSVTTKSSHTLKKGFFFQVKQLQILYSIIKSKLKRNRCDTGPGGDAS